MIIHTPVFPFYFSTTTVVFDLSAPRAYGTVQTLVSQSSNNKSETYIVPSQNSNLQENHSAPCQIFLPGTMQPIHKSWSTDWVVIKIKSRYVRSSR